MNIDDLIRQANPVEAGNVPEGDSPLARRTLAQVLTAHSGGGARRLRRGARPGGRRTLIAACVAAIAAAATAAALAWPAPPEAPHKPPGAVPPLPARTTSPATTPPASGGPTTARQVLMTAAAHVLNGPTTGNYWRVQVASGIIWPGGTKAHPYDITVATGYDQWNPKTPGQKEVEITQQLATRPATPADAAAWRAAGSPTTWQSGQFKVGNNHDGYLAGVPWVANLDATAAASARSATWTVSDGTIGYIEGDEAGLNAAQFGQIPTRPRAVAALLRQYAKQTYCGQHPGSGCSSVNQLVWYEALYLLEDPVSAQVRSATFRVMASLPGVRLLGPMTDPLGRSGYGIAAGPQDPGNANYNPVKAVVIDPATGSLLATEYIGPIPRTVRCMTMTLTVRQRCLGESYLGRSYQGQVDEFVALVSAGWTDASPSLPRSTKKDPTGFPGLPPAGP